MHDAAGLDNTTLSSFTMSPWVKLGLERRKGSQPNKLQSISSNHLGISLGDVDGMG